MRNKYLLLTVCLYCFANFSLGDDINNLLQSAKQGDVSAQYNLGICYKNGEGVPQDYKEAIKWFRLAADQGYAEAQAVLGICYGLGNGVPSDDKEAEKWYRLAAEQGNTAAQFLLGVYYANGKGISQDYEEAVKWFRLAAEKGDAPAQYSLGLCYARGEGVLQDYKEAAKWYRLAAEQGDDKAQSNLGLCYARGQGVLEDYVEAYAWSIIAAMNGNEPAAKNKGKLVNTLNKTQVAAGQERAKELIANIERKKQLAKLPAGQVPAADIAPSGFGSGLLVKGGYVLTCWHVVENAKKISVSCQGKDFSARLIQKDTGNDLAILRVDGADAGVSLSFADSVKLGAQVFTMGFPHPGLQGSDVKFTTGSISGLTGPGNTPVYFQISAPLQSGNSGGPLFDEYGNLVGIVAAKLDSLKMLAATGDLTQNVNYAIKSDYLVPLLKTVDGIKIQPSQTKPVNLLGLVEDLKKSVVMIKVY
ncbi:MAG: tetratricopeptide repeat-containing serine protease family protein [Kiritimatiellales bacterium]